MTAPAKRDNSSPRDSERISRGIFDYDVIAHHAIRAVVIAYDCSFVLIAHYYPRKRIQINRLTIVSQAAISKKHCSRVLLPKRKPAVGPTEPVTMANSSGVGPRSASDRRLRDGQFS